LGIVCKVDQSGQADIIFNQEEEQDVAVV